MNPALPGMPEMRAAFELHWMTTRGGKKASRELKHSELDPSGYGFPSTQRHWWTWQLAWAGGRAEASKDAERWTTFREKVLWVNDGDETKFILWLPGNIDLNADPNIRALLDAGVDALLLTSPAATPTKEQTP